MFEINLATNQIEINKIINLRYDVLRKPWNKTIESATDGNELDFVNAYIKDGEELIACARLQFNTVSVAQIRFMAVSQLHQGKGLGKQLIFALEKIALQHNILQIELQARQNAVNFYLNCGYTVKEKSFLMWDTIQHYLMVKTIK